MIGNFGKVFKAVLKEKGEVRAIKQMRKRWLESNGYMEMALTELRVLVEIVSYLLITFQSDKNWFLQ